MSSEATKLMNARAPPYVDAIINPDVSAQCGMTAHHQMISDDTIMSDVTVSKKYVSRANHGLVIRIRRNMSGHVFSENVIVSNQKARVSALVFQVMSKAADHGIGVNRVVLAQDYPPLDGSMVEDPATIAYPCLGPDHAKGLDHNVFSQLRGRIDDRLRMNACAHVRNSPRHPQWQTSS
jgi:hypothetical protein